MYLAILSSRKGATWIVTDVCVPISKQSQALAETQAYINLKPISAPILGLANDGNFNANLLINPEDANKKRAAFDLSVRIADRTLMLGGTVTDEHGVGLQKYLIWRQNTVQTGASWGRSKSARPI
ncbi:MAG: D-lactate dehydrogenase (cytochrome) [Alteromonas macleodii]